MGVNSQFIALGKLGESSRVADDAASLHTPTMTIKNAALLTLVGTILATVLLVWTFASTVVNVLRGFAPAVMLFSWFIYAFACFSLAVFFYVFHRTQS
jgi:high-affinity K+ transport system ATPase subunit B